jgi:D-alanyl-D-alanine dipeptidase
VVGEDASVGGRAVRAAVQRPGLVAACLAALLAHGSPGTAAGALPPGFVHLADVAPAIAQDMRYAGADNFVGRRVAGYDAARCILTRPAAEALAAVEADLAKKDRGLLVLDCYRPQRAVDDFVAWSRDDDTSTRAAHYPRLEKSELFPLGYIAARSSHTRGSTVDLTVVRLPRPAGAPRAAPAASCIAPDAKALAAAGRLDFGTTFDCFDVLANTDAPGITATARAARRLLVDAMARRGFENYPKEWWHFTLRDEPFPDTYFDFPVR